MTELDFDELDKAVNNIMSGMDTSKRKTGYDEPEEKVIEIPSSEPSAAASASAVATPSVPSEDAATDSVPEMSAVEQAPTEPAQQPSKASEPLAIKRRGQFMDVMHPSSDMKMTVAPKREGVVVQPTARFEAQASQDSENSEDLDTHAPVSPPIIDVVTTPDTEPASHTPIDGSAQNSTEANEEEWPDPIEVAEHAESSQDTDGDGIKEAEPVEIPDVPEEVVQEVAKPEMEPISSPFLADAKVEKRPLGAATPFPESVATPSDPQVTPSLPTNEPLPQELSSDIMELESSSTVGTSVAPAAASEQTASKPSIPGSIPQQYTEQPSSSKVSNAAIYDTSTHQPLDSSAKGSSVMKWVILSLVLLIIGALAGAVYFYMQTQ